MLNSETAAGSAILVQQANRVNELRTGNRYQATIETPYVGAALNFTPNLQRLTKISDYERVARIGIWDIAPGTSPYSFDHVMIFPDRTNFASDKEIWRNIQAAPPKEMAALYRMIGIAADSMLDTGPNINEVLMIINAGGNKSLQFLLHAHVVGIDDRDWQPTTLDALEKLDRERFDLFSHNDGCREHEKNLADILVAQYRNLIDSSYAATPSGSYFFPLQADTFAQACTHEQFPALMLAIDRGLREMFSAWPIQPNQQCFSFFVSRRRGEKPIAGFQAAVKSLNGRQSGGMEADNHIPGANPIPMTPEQNKRYLMNCQEIGRLFQASSPLSPSAVYLS